MKKTKFINLISYSILLAFVCLFFYVFYRSEIYFNHQNFSYYQKYYIISITGIVLSVILIFLKENLKINIFLVFFSSIFALYVIEFLLYFYNPVSANSKDLLDKEKLKLDRNFDIRSRAEVFEAEKNKGREVAVLPVPANIASANEDFVLLSGHSNIENVFCNELGYYIIYKSDRYGFRNPDSEWGKKIKFLIVGDSLAHGCCVEEEDTISGHLRYLNPEKDKAVLNLAMWGNGPMLMYATLREYLSQNKVENIIWLHSEGNDFTDLNWERKSDTLNRYLSDPSFKQDLINKQSKINEYVQNQIRKGVNSHNLSGDGNVFTLKKFLKLTQIRLLTFEKPEKFPIQPLLENLDLFDKVIISANNYAKENNTNFIFVNLPDYFARVNREQKHLLYEEKMRAYDHIKKFTKKNKIKFIDIQAEIFSKHPDPLSLFPFRKHNHFGPEGYKITAETILKNLD